MRAFLLAILVLAGSDAWADQAAKATTRSTSPLKVASAAGVVKLPPSKATSDAAAEARGPSKRMIAQQEAMKALAFLDGEWRGQSKTLRKDGWAPMVQTARVGAMMDGTVRVIEVRSYEADGAKGFEALRILSYDPQKKAYAMRSYQGGAPRDYEVEATANGIAWTVASGRDVSVRYETSVANGVWSETATRTAAKRDAKGPRGEARQGEQAKSGAGRFGAARVETSRSDTARSAPSEPELFLSISMKRLRTGGWPASGALGMK